MHAIIHSTKNTAKTWYNGCTGKNHVGDDGPIEDPDLPILPQEDGVIIHYKDGSCSRKQVQELYKEFTKARSMAREAQLHIQKDGYFNTFFAAENRDPSYASEVYGRISEMIGGNGGYHFEVTCNNKRESCQPSQKGDMNIAAMSTKGVMNICDAFLDHKHIKSTEEREKECGSMSVREAHHSRAAVLLHESSHTSYAMTGQIRGGQPSLDYAYGYEASRDLALGKHDRSCWLYGQRDALRGKALRGPEIGDNFHSESVCNAKLSKNNADSYALVAAGLYFSAHCHKTIPTPPPSTNAAGSDSCPNYDYVQIDESPILGIDRYAHFGDSYAAGMGTGTTTSGTDKQGRCRIGSNNYGKLIDTWLDAEKLTYESHACSGDTTVGLDGQIDTWLHNDPKSTNIGTLTMGGNDVGFSDLVRNCIITSGWYDIDTYRKSCLEAESKALDYIHNSGDGGLGAKLRSAYKRIVNGANDNFHLHVPGYVGFFNHDTEDCDHTTFYYWGSAWEEKQNPDKHVYLTRDLRKELNNLVGALNDLISATIAAANNELGSKRIHYVDMQSHFDSHRWCEADVREPDPNGNSFFFLAGWDDQGTNDIAVAGLSVTEADELQALADQGSIKLPDAATCRESLGTDPDPYAEAMCHVAETVAHDPNGPEAQRLDRANKALANGDLSVQEISWYLPTRTIKMFHPRTPGMAIYRDAVIDSMKASGQFPWW
ncbi:hypothetical protein VN97_g12756 [Penicillium thymicola]|uniref:SGNH hydrolase-type esterase domain-containing protein n=1 Tax=Penicillium thymicola TaxID=293382 RepID=A0AAI9T5R9_PENTH|nr:hypothetical protein VN97_g12756 [Penicillium thymicola]